MSMGMQTSHSFRDQLRADGFAIVPSVLDPQQIRNLLRALENLEEGESIRKRTGTFAVRNLLSVSAEARELAESAELKSIATSILGASSFPVRGILFDKTPDANWKVPWHQDVTIAVADKREVEGFGPWSSKAGVLHVQPPAYVLENMISIRIHLDSCGTENGALKVIPGSHRHGRIPELEVTKYVADGAASTCAVEAGDAVLMRPLLLHASSPSTVPGHRRVIHIDFTGLRLPGGLQWA